MRRLAGVRDALSRLEEGAPPILCSLRGELARAMGCEADYSYGLECGDAIEVAWMHREGFALEHETRFRRYASATNGRWGHFDPRRPDPRQRNRALTTAQMVRLTGREAPIFRDVFPGAGISDNLRVLVCDGEALLANVGLFRIAGGRFDAADARALQSLVPALRRRLVIERQVEEAPVRLAILDAILEKIPSPAFVLTPGLAIAHANSAGQVLLERERAAVRASLRDAVMRGSPAWDVTSIAAPGAAEHFLAIARETTAGIEGRARALGGRIGLTPRQREVLEKLAEGKANKTIAAELGCAEATIEVHVSAILRKAQVGGRAELVAKVLGS